MVCILRHYARSAAPLALACALAACAFPAVDLAPPYQPPRYVVPVSWQGSSPFVEAKPSDGELRPDWWREFHDPILDSLEDQAMVANPDLQAAAERFVQARDVMMKARAQYLPRIGLEIGASGNKQSVDALFRPPNISEFGTTLYGGGLASWEPDFWSALRNATRLETYRAQERAADYGLARLSLQAEVAANYFTLRGYDAQSAIYAQSIELYKQSLALVNAQFVGAIASALDVARVESLLFSTETKYAQIQGQRQVTEQAIAILLNKAPAAFTIDSVNELRVAHFTIPHTIPSTLLERRPDIAAMERRMAEANRAIGMARAAFFPNVSFRLSGGFEDNGFNLISLANSFWSYGSAVSLPLFQAGYRRAQLQQSWSAYRETEDLYRSTVLNAFREVENNLSLTNRLTAAANRQDAAVGATQKAQDLTMELYQGGLASSLELIYAQVATLTARIDSVQVKAELLRSSVALLRALGGGWHREQLPTDDQIQPFGTFQYTNLDKPPPAGGIDVNADNNWAHNDLTTRTGR
ncbi:efflux transporter outer membrane subunit [Nitrospirales bacterium NOB]|nr:MAG: efflux transporter outer membrane factor lipoprotein [Nitrospira sp. OLB3]MBV6470177.1 Outer membrane protein OprM [Nitrospirota bacterium]MCE7964210.1 efflux transporter outer membrane subunit [Nitrospira sp. NTP2]MCK6492712.1 efflux transporter outer membrane subunit [Nitrospira sp.]MDL1888675.1 efflux transporter outer membrane subunit [Nitrospirales bacterium NOB]MEB2337215.1 efflux transporter outer membrane subunit [Nitrospirales bacterium]